MIASHFPSILCLCLISTITKSQDVEHSQSRPFFVIGYWMMKGMETRNGVNPEKTYSELLSLKMVQEPIPESVPFPCNTKNARSKIRPKDVNHVRPGDIDVIGAVGDSLTAGNGGKATHLLQVFLPYREIAWSIGGEATWRKYLTLPNILKEFNPNLIGYTKEKDNFQFNAAEIGSRVKHTLHMTEKLVNAMMEDPRVDMENDWKLVTFMIGGNNFCNNVCANATEPETPEVFRDILAESLDYLMERVPRTIVNVVPPPDITRLKIAGERYFYCRMMHSFLCPCLFDAEQDNEGAQKFLMQTQSLFRQLAEDEKYRKDDFAVLYQPFSMDLSTAVFDLNGNEIFDTSILSADCFHFSAKGHAYAGNSLWNNMLQPIGEKSQKMCRKLFDPFLCPTEERPYIFTYGNSPNITVQVNSQETSNAFSFDTY